MSSDRQRQEDEMEVISSIYDVTEFSYIKKDQITCFFNIFLEIPEKRLKIECPNCDSQILCSDLSTFIEHLPPIRLRISFPHDYPSKKSPQFLLIISWLPPWRTSLVCQKLDEIWEENKGDEILFLWLDFLKNNTLNYLNVRESLDVSFMSMVHKNPLCYFNTNLQNLSDDRAINRALLLQPIRFLTQYDRDKKKMEFQKTIYTCNVCFEEYMGKECIELQSCGHVYCKDCVKHYITIKISTGAVKSIQCPHTNCVEAIIASDVKELCPDLYRQYEDRMLHITLGTMNDIVFCPRKLCQYPIIIESDEPLAICSQCNYSFCRYCYKVYHGVAPCSMTSAETINLIQKYKEANAYQKKLLQKKYGRHQIQSVIEKYLTTQYLKDYTKPCPNCCTAITKDDGCNKMVCIYCQAEFCWLCGSHLTMYNAYDHFMEKGSICYGRLFEGVLNRGIENDILDEEVIVDNILWFNQQAENVVN